MRNMTGERGYQKNAWVLLVAVYTVTIFFGLIELVGMPADPTLFSSILGQSVDSFMASNPRAWSAIQAIQYLSGAWSVGYSVFGIAIARTAFRKGEKWAWYASLSLPIIGVYITALTYTFGASIALLGVPLLAVFLVG